MFDLHMYNSRFRCFTYMDAKNQFFRKKDSPEPGMAFPLSKSKTPNPNCLVVVHLVENYIVFFVSFGSGSGTTWVFSLSESGALIWWKFAGRWFNILCTIPGKRHSFHFHHSFLRYKPPTLRTNESCIIMSWRFPTEGSRSSEHAACRSLHISKRPGDSFTAAYQQKSHQDDGQRVDQPELAWSECQSTCRTTFI